MYWKNDLAYLKKQVNHTSELFINGKDGRLIIEPLTLLKPQSQDDYTEICRISKASGIKFKLIKGRRSQFVNPGYNSDSFVVDVSYLDSILNFDNGLVKYNPGTTAHQLNAYLDSVSQQYLLPLSTELTDPFLAYNQKAQGHNLGFELLEYELTKHHKDSRCIVVGLKSFEDLYNSHYEVSKLKEELGSLISSFFYVNREVVLANQNTLKKSKFINSEKIFIKKNIEMCQWFLFIEFAYNPHIYQGVNSILKDRLEDVTYFGENAIDLLKMPFTRKNKSSGQIHELYQTENHCETLSFEIDDDAALVLFTYHAIYSITIQHNFKPQVLIDFLPNGRIKIILKVFYGSQTDKKNVLEYIMAIIHRVKSRV